MKIYLVSDLHCEMDEDLPLPKIAADVVVLAGDIHRGAKVFDVAATYRRHFHAPVIVLAGNHEYYRSNYLDQLAKYRREAAMLANVFFLENDQVIIEGVRFLGCTLWTNFSLYGDDSIDESKAIAERSVNDFRLIRNGHRRFSPDDAAELYRESYAWLDQQLAQPFDGKTVVVTHFLPHRAGIHPRYVLPTPDKLTPCFATDCANLMQRHSIDIWMYGHTHNSVDRVVENGTRLVSNQRGYPHESHIYTQFDAAKVISI